MAIGTSPACLWLTVLKEAGAGSFFLWVAYSDVLYRQTSEIFSFVHILSHVNAYVAVLVDRQV